MRVTFVLPQWCLKPSGGSRVVYQYANGLAAHGHTVTVVHAAHLELWQYAKPLLLNREPKALARGIVDRLKGRPAGPGWQWIDPDVTLRYVPDLSAGNVPDGDAVVATAWRTAESVIRYPASKGAKHYLIQHYETWDGPRSRVDATWRGPLRKIVIAEWLAQVGERLGQTDFTRIPNGIDHGVFRVVRPINRRPQRVAMLWSPSPIKGGAEGIRALEEARAARPELRAVLFGTRPRPSGLPGWIDYRHNPSQAELVDDIYNGSAIYLCPSRAEGWHLPPAEAMACGCALVSTDIGGVGDYARSEETAVLVPVGDSARMAEGVVRLVDDHDGRVRVAEAGNRLIRTFTWDRAVDELERHLAISPRVA